LWKIKIDDEMEKTKNILNNIYKKYENEYSEIMDRVKIKTRIWAKWLHYNLYPLEIELTGNKAGKLYKTEPGIKKNVVVYGFADNELHYAGIYDGFSSIVLEYILVKTGAENIFLGFYKKSLNRIYVTYLNSNNEPQYTLLFFVDNGIKKYLDQNYEYNNGKISKINESGFREKDNKNIAIIDVVYEILYDDDSIKEIIAAQNNHKSGKINRLKIY
jgi:uncharacterized protein YlaI